MIYSNREFLSPKVQVSLLPEAETWVSVPMFAPCLPVPSGLFPSERPIFPRPGLGHLVCWLCGWAPSEHFRLFPYGNSLHTPPIP